MYAVERGEGFDELTPEQKEQFLLESIEFFRYELDCMVEYRPLNDRWVLNISQTLDVLVTEYYKLKHR